MPITALPTPPTRQDPDNFAERGDEFLAALPAFVTEANALADQMNADQADVAAMAAVVLPASSAALAAANYVGIWNTLAGSLALPASVYHNGRFWILLVAVGNVATTEPGVTSDWAAVSDDVGVIGHFPYSNAPAGWLKADGAAVSRTAYAALYTKAVADGAFAVDGTDWANNPGKFYIGDGSTTFNLPDLRGDHIRALDDGKGVDAGRGLATLQQPQNASHTHTGNTGNQSADHTHSGTTNTTGAHTHSYAQYAGNGSGSSASTYAGPPTGGATGSAGDHSHTITTGGVSASHSHAFTTDSSGGTENRVRTTALLACIKY
ncbi:tail fiber protein [Hydrogenophaga sp.]|uniref:tail fiber protein n=1 Tax=Hydrogenophaga sp. TaxID=1904254 RepID=UPI003D09FA73